jgi:hypothetical protein
MNTSVTAQSTLPKDGKVTVTPPKPDRGGESLSVSYQGFMKVILAVGGLLALRMLWYWMTDDDFVLHLLAVGAMIVGVLYLVECLTTTSITLFPDRIEKRRVLFGMTVIPAQRVFLVTDQHTIRFYHGSSTNLRERVTIRLSMISSEDAAQVLKYAKKQYAIHLEEEQRGGDESAATLKGSGTGKGRQVNGLVLEQFGKVVGYYKLMLTFMAAYAGFAIITVGVADSFTGLAPTLPAYWLRLTAILLAVLSYFLLKRLDPAEAPAASSTARPGAPFWADRFESVEKRSYLSGLLANFITLLGFILFLLLGNLLDFYLFLVVGAYYYLDFYPRLSVWERVSEGKQAELAQSEQGVMPHPARRRSLQVSLVLMGTLAVSSYGETPHYLYKSKKDCLDDWGSEQSCQEPSQGSPYYHTGHYYGPRYGGGGGGGGGMRSTGMRSVGTVSVSRGGFGSLGGFHGSFGG